MEDQYDGLTEEQLWEVAEVDGVVRDAIGSVLQDVQFQASKVDAWAGNVVEGCLKRLAGAGKPFKYVVTCNLAQKVGQCPPPAPRRPQSPLPRPRAPSMP